MLKIIGLSKESAPKTFRANDDKVVGGGNGRTNEMVRNLSRKLTRVPNIRAIGEANFLTSNTKKVFNHLRLAFIKAPIFWHFDPESHIRIEIGASSYAIDGVLSQLNFNSNAPSNDPKDLNLNKSDFS